MQTRFVVLLVSAVALAATSAPAVPLLLEGEPLAPPEVLILASGGAHRDTIDQARREGLLVVDLSDEWAPFIFSDADAPGTEVKPNEYRKTFIALANDRVTADEIFLESPAGRAAVLSTVPGELRSTDPETLSPDEQRALERARRGVRTGRAPSFLEVYGIPPTLSVLAGRVEEDAGRQCYAGLDLDGIRLLDFEIGYQGHDQARRDYERAMEDAAWIGEKLAAIAAEGGERGSEGQRLEALVEDPESGPRVERHWRGQKRLRAVTAVQARLSCEGLLAPDTYTPGVFDHSTHQALAEFERKNDIFGWGFVSGETQAALLRSPMELHLETLRRILAERIADAAGIIEDGSVSRGAAPALFTDAAGESRPVPNLIGDFVDAALAAAGIASPEDMAGFLRGQASAGFRSLRIAFAPPPLPPYYGPVMDLSTEINRGDVWYDVPFDGEGKPLVQPRKHYPTFTLFVSWHGQKIPLVRWRTTIGSWRSELGADGHVYLKYKNSDVGPRIWRHIVAAPVWVPPPATPGKDLVAKKVFDRRQGPVTVVNTEIMGPGFASAYGLVMAVHLEKRPDGSTFDNQIRTHGSVDYTSIARRFSHGCHRLVNNRAVRLFDFVLKHHKYKRLGSRRLTDFKRRFEYQGRRYAYEIPTRGYYYELRPAVPMTVLEGNVRGRVREPIEQYVRKPGVDYGTLPAGSPIEPVPVAGP